MIIKISPQHKAAFIDVLNLLYTRGYGVCTDIYSNMPNKTFTEATQDKYWNDYMGFLIDTDTKTIFYKYFVVYTPIISTSKKYILLN